MYCCAHKTATLTPIQHTVLTAEHKALYSNCVQGYQIRKLEKFVSDFSTSKF